MKKIESITIKLNKKTLQQRQWQEIINKIKIMDNLKG